jgi:hypothetical protein
MSCSSLGSLSIGSYSLLPQYQVATPSGGALVLNYLPGSHRELDSSEASQLAVGHSGSSQENTSPVWKNREKEVGFPTSHPYPLRSAGDNPLVVLHSGFLLDEWCVLVQVPFPGVIIIGEGVFHLRISTPRPFGLDDPH